MESFQNTADSNTNKVNEAIASLSTSLKTEREKFEVSHQSLQADRTILLSYVKTSLTNLKTDLAWDNKVREDLALSQTQVATLSLELSQANMEIESLRAEDTVLKSCVNDVHSLTSNLLEAHDSVLTISVRRHLTDKLLPALEMLSRIRGVTEPIDTPQQGGDVTQDPPIQPPIEKSVGNTTNQPKVTTKPKGNEASSSSVLDKKKGLMGQSDEEEETEEELLKRKKRYKELDERSK
uniref:Uncharacterized protein n=1 Tax=Lactuca sativa TaxID=4236 RepID=A0A9R1VEG9_LACSA|nr:hypothetical protein LSAT_V11C500229060 [Lactuca sativa]